MTKEATPMAARYRMHLSTRNPLLFLFAHSLPSYCQQRLKQLSRIVEKSKARNCSGLCKTGNPAYDCKCLPPPASLTEGDFGIPGSFGSLASSSSFILRENKYRSPCIRPLSHCGKYQILVVHQAGYLSWKATCKRFPDIP